MAISCLNTEALNAEMKPFQQSDHILTWQQHSFLPHHRVKALRKRLDEVVGVCYSGSCVDFLRGHSFRVLGPVRYVLSYRAWKQHWLLEEGWEGKSVFHLLCVHLLYWCALCCTRVRESFHSPGWLFQCDSWASRGSDLWCHDHR